MRFRLFFALRGKDWSYMPEILLGLDMGSRNIKAALIKCGKKYQILNAEVLKTPDGSVSDGMITYMNSVVECVNAYIGKSGVKPAGLAICVNSPDIITRNLTLPALAAAEIPPAVKFEIVRFFPSIKDSHEITQTVLSTGESSVSVLAALCPRVLIQCYQELSARLGLQLRRLGIRADAQAKAIEYFCAAAERDMTDDDATIASGTAEPVGRGFPDAPPPGASIASGIAEPVGRDAPGAPPPGASTASGIAEPVGRDAPGAPPPGASTASGTAEPVGRDAPGAPPPGASTASGTAEPVGRGFPDAPPPGAAGILIDIGYQNSLVSVINKGKLVLSRYTMGGASAYDSIIAEKIGVLKDDVENARLSGNFSHIPMGPDDAERAMNYSFMDISDQLRQITDLYDSDPANDALSFIAVTGEGGLIPGIKKFFAASQNLRPRLLMPAGGKTGYAALHKKGGSKLLLAALGTVISGASAQNDINFAAALSGAGTMQNKKSSRLVTALAAAILIAIAAVAAGVYFINDLRRTSADIADIRTEITQDLQAAVQIEAIGRAQLQLSTLDSVIKTIDANSADVSGLLDDLTAQMPEGLFITNLNMLDPANVVMSGRARVYDSISEFALLLRQTGKYESVRINAITANQTASDLISDYGFTMTLILSTK